MNEARGTTGVFGAVGRFSVRFRWLIVIGWVAATVASVHFLPGIGGVIKNDTTAFLPADSPSVRATTLAAPFLVANAQVGTIVATRLEGQLGAADDARFAGVERQVARVPDVVSVHDAAVSVDGQARTAIVEFSNATEGGGHAGAQAVASVRAILTASERPGEGIFLTGPLPELVDQQAAGNHTANHVQLISAIFILALLALAFRSALAPLVTLAPAGLALALAGPLIAESSKLGVQISSLMQLLLTALVLGAGTDYGLFLIFRYRENLRKGLSTDEAIVASVSRVGESISFSALTVIAALLSLVVASFGLYRGVGPGLAIGIAVVLLIELTFFPALLSILGGAVFWPSAVRPGPPVAGRWGRIAVRISGRPVAALVVGTAVLGGLAASLVAYAPSGFDPGGYIVGSNSGIGEEVLAQHFGVASLSGTDVLFRLRHDVWTDTAVLDHAQDGLSASGSFSSVTGALQANGVRIAPDDLAYAYRRLGPPGALPATEPRGTRIDPFFYNAYRATAGFISGDGRTILYRVGLVAGSPGSTGALQAIPSVRSEVAAVGRRIGAVETGVAGQAAGAADVSAISASDILRVAPLVMVVLALLLALVLRSLVAPLYLVASVGLSYLASLGLAVLLFVVLGGQLGINFTLPFFMFVFIMALGEDYNILLMTRIREEAATRALRPAVVAALGTTGTTITSAGLVLAGTFGILAIATSGQVRQIGTGLALGILLDTFVVRTLLVPSVVVLLGRWNWWPSRLSRRTAAPPAAPPVPVRGHAGAATPT